MFYFDIRCINCYVLLDVLVTFGDMSTQSVETTYVNTKMNRSCSLSDLPAGYELPAAIDSNSYGIISCGGRTENKSTETRGYKNGPRTFYCSNKCWRLTDVSSWKTFPSLNKARCMFTLNQLNNRLVAVGGMDINTGYNTQYQKYNTSKYRVPHDSLEYIDLNTTNEWTTKLLDFGTIWDHCSVTIDDQYIMLIGGTLNDQVIEII